MMNHYEILQDKVETDSLKLIHAIGVPRSVSTAFCRALNNTEENSIYVNEPFNRGTTDAEGAAKSILDSVQEADLADGPTLVIVKNMASYMDTASFQAFNELSSGTVWNIRNPLVQIGSLLTRIVNDLEVASGANEIDQADIYPYINRACEFLINSPKSVNYSKTGWESIRTHFRNRNGGVHLAVDGEEFTKNPSEVLSSAATRLQVAFSENMVMGWRKGFINVVNRDNISETEQSAWTSRAARSLGVLAVHRAELDMDRLPASLVEHIQSTAMPAYAEIAESAKTNQ